MLLLQEFDIEIRDKSGAENVVADHLSRIEGPVDEVDSKGPRSKRGYHRGGVGDVDEDEVGGSDIEREIEKKSVEHRFFLILI